MVEVFFFFLLLVNFTIIVLVRLLGKCCYGCVKRNNLTMSVTVTLFKKDFFFFFFFFFLLLFFLFFFPSNFNPINVLRCNQQVSYLSEYCDGQKKWYRICLFQNANIQNFTCNYNQSFIHYLTAFPSSLLESW